MHVFCLLLLHLSEREMNPLSFLIFFGHRVYDEMSNVEADMQELRSATHRAL